MFIKQKYYVLVLVLGLCASQGVFAYQSVASAIGTKIHQGLSNGGMAIIGTILGPTLVHRGKSKQDATHRNCTIVASLVGGALQGGYNRVTNSYKSSDKKMASKNSIHLFLQNGGIVPLYAAVSWECMQWWYGTTNDGIPKNLQWPVNFVYILSICAAQPLYNTVSYLYASSHATHDEVENDADVQEEQIEDVQEGKEE